jgi:autotransporter translocation and assembly factor TamB
MGKHILKRFIFFTIILLVLSGAFVFLLNTECGLRFSFAAVSKVIPGELVAQKLDGCLIGPIDAEKVFYKNKVISLSIDKVHLDWRLKELLFGRIDISEFYVDTLKINTKTNEANKSRLESKDITASLKRLRLPKWLMLGDLQFKNVFWQQDAYEPIKISSIIFQSNISGEDIVFLKGEVRAYDAMVLVEGTAQKEWDISWKVRLPSLKVFFREAKGFFYFEGEISGARNNPKIDSTIKAGQFKCGKVSFAGLQGKANIDLSAKKGSGFGLNISSAKINTINFDRLAFSGRLFPVKLKNQWFKLNLDIGITKISFPVGANSQSLKLEKGNVEGLFGKQGVSTKSIFFVSQYDPIDVELKFPKLKNFASLFDEQAIMGQVKWQTKNLNFLQTALPIKDVQGALNIQYTIGGTLQAPKVIGLANLTGASFWIPAFNIKLQNIGLSMRNVSNKIEYQATMNSGGGVLKAVGETLFSDDITNNKILIDGNNFLLANTTEYKVTASPHLVLQTNDNSLELKGKIFIPKALVKPENFGGRDSLPPEVVYIEKGKIKENKMLSLYSQLQLNLGKNVFVDVMGLTGKVEGQVRITDDPKKSTTALGELDIKDGSYNIYGRKLKLTKGRLTFVGGEISNPEVNVEIKREFKTSSAATPFFGSLSKDLTVGVRMQGMLDNAKPDLFSIPSGLSNIDIISYLMIGKPSQQAAGDKTQLLLQAASALNFGGVGEVSGVVDDLKEKLGFSEFGFVEETSLDQSKQAGMLLRRGAADKPGESLTTNTAFALGRFLSPRLYVSYSIGFLDSVSIFRARYYMGKYWSVQSESSIVGNGMDLLYSIERD